MTTKQAFYVILFDWNRKDVEKYDIVPYFVEEYKFQKNQIENEGCEDTLPKTFEEWREWVDHWARYRFWSRSQYEIVISDWPDPINDTGKKIDVYWQISMNINTITKIVKNAIEDEHL